MAYKRNGWYYCKPRGHKAVALNTKNGKIATRLEAKIKADVELGRYFPNTKSRFMTIGELTKRYNDERSNEKLSLSSRQSDQARRNVLLRFMSANTNIKDLTQDEMTKMVNWMRRQDYKEGVINEQFGYVKRVFDRAIYAWKIVGESKHPTKGLTPPPQSEHRFRYLSEDETKRLWNVLDRPEWDWMRDIITVGLQVGFRKSNLAFMQWDWVDLDNRTITIPELYVLKVKKGKKRVPFVTHMSDDVYGTLGRLYQARNQKRGVMIVRNYDSDDKKQKFNGEKFGLPPMSVGRVPISNNQRDQFDVDKDGSRIWGLKKPEDRFVFFVPTLKARQRTYAIYRLFCKSQKDRSQRSVCEIAGIKDFTVHDMKHDFCTKLLDMDVDVLTVQKLAAHKSVTQTQKYTHVLEAGQQKAVKKFKPRTTLLPISSHK